MTLTVLDRLLLLGLLPAEGDITTLRIVRTLRDDLSFSESEHAAFKLVQADGKVTWDQEAAATKDVPMGPKAMSIIVELLTKLSTDKKLTANHVNLYEKFVGNE